MENRAPSSIGLSAQIIDENAANGSVIGSISVSDANTNESQTLSLVNDAGGRFRLEGSNLVVAAGSLLDYEQATSHLITLRSTDEALLSRDQSFTIQLANLIDSPPGTLNLAAASLQFQEGTPATVTVYRTNGVEGVVGATAGRGAACLATLGFLATPDAGRPLASLGSSCWVKVKR